MMISDKDLETLKKYAATEKRRIARMLAGATAHEDDVFMAQPIYKNVIDLASYRESHAA